MLCSRCGAEIAPTQRYCMKCGAINYEHPENASMKRYITKEEIEKSNENYALENDASMQVQIEGRVFKTKRSHPINYIDSRATLTPIILVTILIGLLCYFWLHFSIIVSLVVGFIYFICTFYIMATACIYMKGGYSGFAFMVPFYGQYAFFDIALGKGWYFLFTLIPIAGLFFSLYANYKLAKTFGKSGWATVFFPFIMYPIIAFSDSSIYDGEGEKYKKFVTSDKKRHVMFPAIIYSVLLFLVVFLLTKFVFAPLAQQVSFISDTKIVLHNVEKSVVDGNYMCDGVGAGQVEGTYYIVFDDASELSSIGPIKSSYNGKKMSGYIKIEVVPSRTLNFYITITDGMQGLEEAYGESYETWVVRPMDTVMVPENAIVCKKS